MKSFFALLAGFVLLAPAVLASPAPFPGGKGGGHAPVCVPVGQQCGGKHGSCCEGHKCKSGGDGGHGKGFELSIGLCCEVGHGEGHGGGHKD